MCECFRGTETLGSVFWFDFELTKGTRPLQKMRSQMDQRPLFNAHGARILVAEDNAVNQLIAVRMLEKLGARADVAGDGNEVVDSLRNAPYDLVLMDCQMPVLDGYETSRLIRNSKTVTFREIPIIAMTANAMNGDREKCLEAGMNDYVTKPVRLADLSVAIEKWLTTKG